MKRKFGFTSDAAFVLLLVFLFVCVMYLSMYPASENMIIFVAACAVMIVTHFTSVTVGLVINIVIIFAGTSWLLFGYAVYDSSPVIEPYFWIVMLPLLTLSAGIMAKTKGDLVTENEELKKELASFSTIDDLTGLKNLQAYENDMPVYANIAQRNDLTLVLLVLEFRYQGEMKAFVGDERLKSLSVRLSQIIGSTLRGADIVYLLSREPYRWGALLLLKSGTQQIVTERLKRSVAEENFSEYTDKHDVQPEVRIGTGENMLEDSPQDLLDTAVRSMEYDV